MNSDFKIFLIKLAGSKISTQDRILARINQFLQNNTVTLGDLNEAGDLIIYDWTTAVSPLLKTIAEDWAGLLISQVYLADGTSPFYKKVIETDLVNFIKQIADEKQIKMNASTIIKTANQIYENLEDEIIETLNKFKYTTNSDIIVTKITPDLKIIVANEDIYGYDVEYSIPDVLENLDIDTIESYI